MRLRSYNLVASIIQIKIKFIDRPSWVCDSACSPTDDTLQLTHALEQLWQRYPARLHAVPCSALDARCSGPPISLLPHRETGRTLREAFVRNR